MCSRRESELDECEASQSGKKDSLRNTLRWARRIARRLNKRGNQRKHRRRMTKHGAKRPEGKRWKRNTKRATEGERSAKEAAGKGEVETRRMTKTGSKATVAMDAKRAYAKKIGPKEKERGEEWRADETVRQRGKRQTRDRAE
eukprot:2610047-Pleurochrysis_carterae.AAC.1